MCLLVVVLNYRTFFRFVSPILAELRRRDENIEIMVIAPDVEKFRSEIEGLSYQFRAPVDTVGSFTAFFRRVRTVLAYVYWALIGVQSELVLERMEKKFFSLQVLGAHNIFKPRSISTIARALKLMGLNRILAGLNFTTLRILERLMPADKKITDHIANLNPDAILATPTLYPQHYDVDYVKAGLRLKIPTIATIASWDHLSSKGLLSLTPDMLLVWSQTQIEEAHEYHGIPVDRIRLTGAPSFDWLFEKRFLLDRNAFCAKAGLDISAPYILWAASAPGNCRDEKLVVRLVLKEMKNHPSLQNCQVVIRPHPNDPRMWDGWNERGTVLWKTPSFPYREEDFIDLYNSIFHAVAVTGLSTSVFLETSILDRPCAIIKRSEAVPETVFNQTLHFKYMLENYYPEATEHEADFACWLSDIVQGNDPGREARMRFVKSFLRPIDINRPAAEVGADAIIEVYESTSNNKR